MEPTAIRPKERLLAAAVDYVAGNGVRDLSLRQLAAALGTSHRMLLYHFGSKEELLIEVVQMVEERQRRALAEIETEVATGGSSPAEVVRRMWRRLADPALWAHERLFFELYGRALGGDPGAAPLLEGIVEMSLEPVTELVRRQGVPARKARATARLGVAVVRGLLLDLLATGDREGTEAAMERFIAMYETEITGLRGSA